jgi:hypothetical protein
MGCTSLRDLVLRGSRRASHASAFNEIAKGLEPFRLLLGEDSVLSLAKSCASYPFSHNAGEGTARRQSRS